MLRILEKELDLDPNILNNLMPKAFDKGNLYSKTTSFLGSNKFYSRVLPFILYIICMLTSILLLNKYNLFLSESNVKTVMPLLLRENNINY